MAIGDGVSAIATLAMTFGGFSPTAMDGVEATREQIERLQVETERKREIAKRKHELAMARTSKPQIYVDSIAEWTYVVVDEHVVRITACKTEASKLAIPEEIGGYPVYELAADACSRLESVEEIICSDTLEHIGACAFRFCPSLRRVVFPHNVSEFSASWLQQCPSLEELVLPGMLERIPAAVFDNGGLKRLFIGKSVRSIEPGAFQNTQLEGLIIHEGNPFVKTDGTAVYTADGGVLVALGRPVECYRVLEGCKRLEKKACYGIGALKQISLPEGFETLGPFSLSHTGLVSFEAPSSLQEVGEKAFYYCRQLSSIRLNEGLSVIGASAFEESFLSALHIPASIREIGNSMTVRTNIVHSGPNCTLEIDEASESLFLDGEGGLYRREDDGVHFVQLIDREVSEFSVMEGTCFVNDGAFAYHDCIERVMVPEGVVSIGDNAFRFCSRLAHVELPDTLERLGKSAFIDTMLESLRIPAALEHIGSNALVTKGAHRGEDIPSLRCIEVATGNPVYFMERGMLCRKASDGVHVVMFTSSETDVVFPDGVVGIDPYAFNNARGIDFLSLNKELHTISTAGLTTWCWIRLIHVELEEPVEGRTEFDFRFPETPKSKHGISQGIGGATWVNVPGIMAQYDNCVATARDYNAPRNPDNISAYDQVTRILDRLCDPVLLTPFNRGVYERLLRGHLVEICVDVARHDDRLVIDRLVEFGFVNADNLEEIIMAVSRLQDAAMTGYLLELKRLRFGKSAFDYDL